MWGVQDHAHLPESHLNSHHLNNQRVLIGAHHHHQVDTVVVVTGEDSSIHTAGLKEIMKLTKDTKLTLAIITASNILYKMTNQITRISHMTQVTNHMLTIGIYLQTVVVVVTVTLEEGEGEDREGRGGRGEGREVRENIGVSNTDDVRVM